MYFLLRDMGIDRHRQCIPFFIRKHLFPFLYGELEPVGLAVELILFLSPDNNGEVCRTFQLEVQRSDVAGYGDICIVRKQERLFGTVGVILK